MLCLCFIHPCEIVSCSTWFSFTGPPFFCCSRFACVQTSWSFAISCACALQMELADFAGPGPRRRWVDLVDEAVDAPVVVQPPLSSPRPLGRPRCHQTRTSMKTCFGSICLDSGIREHRCCHHEAQFADSFAWKICCAALGCPLRHQA